MQESSNIPCSMCVPGLSAQLNKDSRSGFGCLSDWQFEPVELVGEGLVPVVNPVGGAVRPQVLSTAEGAKRPRSPVPQASSTNPQARVW